MPAVAADSCNLCNVGFEEQNLQYTLICAEALKSSISSTHLKARTGKLGFPPIDGVQLSLEVFQTKHYCWLSKLVSAAKNPPLYHLHLARKMALYLDSADLVVWIYDAVN